MREMKNSGIEWISEIPKEWSSMRLKHIKNNDRYAIVDGPFGTAISTDDYVDDGVPLVRITNIKSPQISDEDMVYITEEHASTLQRSRLNKGDIVFAKTGATIGKCGINNAIDYGILSSSCVKIAISEKYNNRYFYYLFYTDQFNRSLRDACVGTTRDTINLIPFSNLKVCVPKPEEQVQIADFLDKKVSEIDNVISKTKESIEEYKKLKQSIITETVTKGLDSNAEMKDSGIEWVGDIPANWNTIKIKNIADPTIQDSFMDGDWIESPYITTEGIKYYTTGNIGDGTFKYQGDGYISFETFEKLKCKYAYGGDLVISRLNEPYGRACILPEEIDRCVLAVDIVILRPKKEYNRKYLCYLTMCNGYHKAVEDNARGTAMKRISRNNLGNIVLPVPSVEEQTHIVNFLDKYCSKYDGLISKKEQVITELEQYKKSLIYEYVTGKKEVV